jgi:hypothetical protein
MPAALLALAIGAFAIGTTEFIMMGLLPEIADAFRVSVPTPLQSRTREMPAKCLGGARHRSSNAFPTASRACFALAEQQPACQPQGE